MVRGEGGELAGAGVDRLVDGPDAEDVADLASVLLAAEAELGDLRVRETMVLREQQRLGVERLGRGEGDRTRTVISGSGESRRGGDGGGDRGRMDEGQL